MKSRTTNPHPLTYCFDIDGTLCTQEPTDYTQARPIPERVNRVNQLYLAGHVIKLFTSRGSRSGLDWEMATRQQVLDWGLLFDELILGKPHADFFVDDKAIHSDEFNW